VTSIPRVACAAAFATLLAIPASGMAAEATIRFPGGGTKHLSLAWAPLKKLG
jgi:hypothetical protein